MARYGYILLDIVGHGMIDKMWPDMALYSSFISLKLRTVLPEHGFFYFEDLLRKIPKR